MQIIQRQTIIFFLPLGMEAFTNDQSPYSATTSGQTSWDRRQLYINPTTINYRETKIVKSDLTKGGYVTQYWGEELPKLEISGTTGSSGIEGINVLRDIYRHEQLQYRKVLAERQRALAESAMVAAEEAALALAEYPASAGGVFTGIADTLTGGAFSDTISGLGNAVDIITEPFGGGTSAGETYGNSGGFKSIPSLAAFATNVDMYYQGEFFRGYFTNFSVTENATDPGHFTYQFGFTVTRRTGRRSNFMPWHREALSADGETMMSLKTTVAKGEYPGNESLTFPTEQTQLAVDVSGVAGHVSSDFSTEDVEGPSVQNAVPLNRNASLSDSNS